MNFNLKDKVVVITGSSRGIGNALISAFSNEKSKVVINYYKSEKEADDLYRKIIKNNVNCIKVKADITNPEDVRTLTEKTISTFGTIDVLVNNAGICDDINIIAMKNEQWKRVIDINLTGAFLCCKSFANIMIDKKGGKIINPELFTTPNS